MSTTGTIKWLIRGDDSKLAQDLDKSRDTVEKSSGGFASAAGKIGGAIAGAMSVKAIADWGSSFETSLAAASTLFGDVNVDVDKLSQNMLDLSDRTGLAADGIGDALYNALSAGVPATEDMSEALAFLENSSKLAAAGFTDIDTAQSATIKTLNAYGMDVAEADRIQKVLIQTQNKGITTVGELGSVLAQVTPTASLMGVSFEQVGASLATMTAKGTSTAQATTQLNSMLAELGKEGTKSSDKFRELTGHIQEGGLSFTEAMDMGMDLNDVLQIFQEEADRSGLSMLDFFSSIEAGKAAASIIGDDFVDNLAAMSTEVDVVGESYDKVTNTSGHQFNVLLNQLKNIAIDLFLALAPFITEVLPVLGDLFRMLVPPLIEIAKQLLPPMLDLFSALIPPLMELISAVLRPIIELFKFLLEPIQDLLDLLAIVIKWLVDTFFTNWNQTWASVKRVFTDIWQSVYNFFRGIWDSISAVFGDRIRAIKNYIADLRAGIAEAIAGIKRIFTGLIDFVAGIFTGDWRRAMDGIKNIFGGAFDALKGLMKAPINWIIDGINKFIGSLSSIKIPKWVPLVGGKGISLPTIPRLEIGMDYVPGDDFPALLHAGEAVLTAEEADRWRKGLPRFDAPDFGSAAPGPQIINLEATIEADGYVLGKVMLENIDDARFYG